MSGVFIVAACRSPIGSFMGQFANFSASDLMKPVLEEAVKRAGISGQDIDEIYIGNVLGAGKGQNPARQASIAAGIPTDIPATTINLLCGSGLKTVMIGYNTIKSGNASIIVAGGMESMSQAEHTVYMRNGIKMGDGSLKDSLIIDGLTDAMFKIHMGLTAEEVATRYEVTRDEQDVFAYKSQRKAAAALEKGLFRDEIVGIREGKSENFILQDEYPKPNTTIEVLAKLKPAFFKPTGTVTAGNASGTNDGAAAVIIVDESEISAKGLKPLAQIIGHAEVAIDPIIMGISPVKAVEKLLTKIKWNIEEVDLFELNEAFAAQSLAVLKELKLPEEKVNINGGAIALGHPIGCSGTRVLVTLIYNLKRRNLKRGICALCVGGGMGVAMAIEIC